MKKWIIIFLSLAIIVSGVIIAYSFISQKDGEEPLPDPTTILYNDSYYQIKSESVAESAGAFLTYLTTDTSNTYIPTSEETSLSLHSNISDQKTTLIFKNKNQYKEAIFANFAVDSTECRDITEAFSFFSVGSDLDIKSISQVKSNTSSEISGNVITSPEAISVFYNEILKLEKFSEDEYHTSELANATDVEEYDKRTRNRRVLLIKTASGLEFHMECYPHFKWVYSPTTRTYYKMNDAFSEWSKSNLK